ncbi:hypothetical protein [Caballeronia sp. RCC_10]|uniref:hypothetical protein n=1 Tax=Caballeronia sp. RCC_10 TaxID=3239227 RepID=UPI0035261499
MNSRRPLVFPFIASFLAIAALASNAQAAELPTDSANDEESVPVPGGAVLSEVPSSGLADFCFFASLPSSGQNYKIIKKLKIGKGTYGSVENLLPTMAERARQQGADAIIEYTGSQRFGFWPWRMVRPVVRGVAVQWTEPKPATCESIGGTKLSTILSSHQAPAQ